MCTKLKLWHFRSTASDIRLDAALLRRPVGAARRDAARFENLHCPAATGGTQTGVGVVQGREHGRPRDRRSHSVLPEPRISGLLLSVQKRGGLHEPIDCRAIRATVA